MHAVPYLNDILILLAASIAIVLVFRQFNLSPVLGYLIVGAMIGPFGFKILESNATTASIAEIGILFLLFAIGLELSLEKLKSMKKYVLGFGGLQVLLTMSALTLAAKGIFHLETKPAIIIASALSLSSTAIVLQIIHDCGEQTTRVGRLAFSVLILQDLAVIPILVLLPLFAKDDSNIFLAISGAVLNAVIALAIIFAVGRLLIRPIFRYIADIKSDILFTSVILMIIFGAAQLSSFFGLSSAFGAFTAGLMVAETEYKYRVEEEIMSFKGLLMGLFFITIGMSFELNFMLTNAYKIVLAGAALLLIKAVIIIALCKAFRLPLAPSIHTGLLLSQGGEFAFIVFLMAIEHNLLSQETTQFLATVVTATMAVTPLLASFGRKIKGQLYIMNILKDNKIKREIGEISGHNIVIGFGRTGRVISYILRKKQINYLALDNNHRLVHLEKLNGYNIYYGDAMNIDILRHIGIERSKSVIVAMEDEIACMKITRFIAQNFPSTNVITKSENINNAERFKKIGANFVVSKSLEAGLQITKLALLQAKVSPKEIEQILNEMRSNKTSIMQEFVRDRGDGGTIDQQKSNA